MRRHAKNFMMIILGALICASGINYFTIPNQLAEGGLTGIALILKYVFNFSPALATMLLNIPLFIIGWRELGKMSMLYTIFGTTVFSFSLWVTEGIGTPIPDDLLLAALYAGVFVGLGLGIIFRYGGTTGGTDIIARLFYKYFGWSMGRTMFVVDLIVILSSAYFVGRERAMYTVVAVFIGSGVIDFVQEGAYTAKAAFIVSNSASQISQAMLKEMDRGTTLLKGKGGYTGLDKEVLYCVVARNEVTRLKALVHQIDPYAFIVINDVHDVLGEGFSFTEEEKRKLLSKKVDPS
mgnify:CR=1 FL=1